MIQLMACGSRQHLLSSTFAGVKAADDAFATWDRSHQDGIVSHATTLADGEAQLAAYRADRARVEAAFVVAYKALAAALLDSDSSTTAVLAAAADLYRAIEALRAPPAPSPGTSASSTTPPPVAAAPAAPAPSAPTPSALPSSP